MGPAVRLGEAGSRSHGGTARGPFHDMQPTWRGCEGRWGAPGRRGRSGQGLDAPPRCPPAAALCPQAPLTVAGTRRGRGCSAQVPTLPAPCLPSRPAGSTVAPARLLDGISI